MKNSKLFSAGLLAATMGLIPGGAQAISWNWPIVTHVDILITSPTTARYTVTMGTISEEDERITGVMTFKKAMDTLGMGGFYPSGKTVFWSHYHRHNNAGGGVSSSPTRAYQFSTEERFVSVAATVTDRYGSGTFSIIHSGGANGNECVGSTTHSSSNDTGFNFDEWLSRAWNGLDGISKRCLGTPPPNEWCALSTPAVTLEFGNVGIRDIARANAEAKVGVQCTTGMKYTLRLVGADAIPLSNGLKAELSAAGQPLGATLNGAAGDNTVDLTAKLSGNNPTDGAFSGQGVLFVSYP